MRGYLGLGSNLGDRLGALQSAVDLLAREPGLRIDASSRVYETDPVGGPAQPDYLNAVVRVETELTPHETLEACRRTETALGRVRDVRWGPRAIDIDVLLLDALTVDEPDLTVPHPRIADRAFVLLPLLELEPDPMLPGGRTLASVTLGPEGAQLFAPPLSTRPAP